MSAYNRYSFTKNVYPDYIVLLLKDNKYYSYGKDKKVLDYLKFNNRTSILRKRKINYLVLDELEIIEKYNYSDNQLDRYLHLVRVKKIFHEINKTMLSKF